MHDNLGRLAVERLGAVNLRKMDGFEGSMAAQWTVLADLQSQGLVADLGLSNVSAAEVEELQQIAPVACVQNAYNLAQRGDDDLDRRAAPSRASSTSRSSRSAGSARSRSPRSTTSPPSTARRSMQVALAWLLQRSPNILLIPGTSSVAHLEENLAAGRLVLDDEDLAILDKLG